MRFLGSTTFEVSSPKVTAEIRNYDEGKGTFDVVVTPESKSGIQIIQVPVWCAGNQSDINWYTAEKQSDAFAAAEEKMKETAENDKALLLQARQRAETLLEEYARNIGELQGKEYQVEFVKP